MVEYFIELLTQLPTAGVLAFVFFITFVENVFPPSPSDLLLVFCGTLIGLSGIGFAPMVIAATTGSLAGFAIMFWVGVRFGDKIKHSNNKMLPREAIERAEGWFQQYGLWVIVVNRFLSGTRAVIALFAGMSELQFSQTMILSAVSATLWNAILLGAGATLGNNWMTIEPYLTLYGQIAGALVIAIILFIIARAVLAKRPKNQSAQPPSIKHHEQTPHE